MELSNQDKISAIKDNLLSIAQRSYQFNLDMEIARANGNDEAVGQYQTMIDELAVSVRVYNFELAKLGE